MDHTDPATDCHPDMTAMVVSGPCVATALSVPSKMATIPSTVQTNPSDTYPCDSDQHMDHPTTYSGHPGSQSHLTSQSGVETNTDKSSPSLEQDQPTGDVDIPNGTAGDSTDVYWPSRELDQHTGNANILCRVEAKTDTLPPPLELHRVPSCNADTPSRVEAKTDTLPPPLELHRVPSCNADTPSRVEAKTDTLPPPLELHRVPSGNTDTPSDVITSDSGEYLKGTSAVTHDENSADHVMDNVTENRTESCDSPTENTRSLRRCRKRVLLDGDSRCCPICGTCVRQGELSNHLMVEVEKLNRLSSSFPEKHPFFLHRPMRYCERHKEEYAAYCGITRNLHLCGRKMSQDGLTSSHGKKSRTVMCRTDSSDDTSKSRYEMFQRIQSERQSRMAAQHKKKASESRCPVCNKSIVGSPSDLILHVDQCLMNKGEPEEDCIVDIDGDEDTGYEEYTWAGQTRVRVTTMLEGGLAGSGFKCAMKDEDEDGDLNVDEDESEMFGQPQYSEGDLIPCCSDEPAEERARKALRKAVLKNETGLTSTSKENGSPSASEVPSQRECNTNSITRNTVLNNCQVDTTEVIASLKARIQQDVVQLAKSNIPRCLICMETYTRPLTSIQCWHVYCEDCWLRTLGAKKLCPQCNMITSPTDLRRIYL